MQTLAYVTGNPFKFEIARKSLEGLGVKLIQKNIETPEIQSLDVKEIASFSAKWVSRQLNSPVAVTDAGFYIRALNGFPGPFVKYMNQWFTADQILVLMKGQEDRVVEVKGCLAYCKPGGEPMLFESLVAGKIVDKPGKIEHSVGVKGTPLNQIFIPEGFSQAESELSQGDALSFWAGVESYWKDLAGYLS